MIQRRYYKTIRVIVDSDGGGTPFYIENVDSGTGYFKLEKKGTPAYTPNLNYRIDNGEWFEYDVASLPRIEVPIGSKIYLKGNNPNGFNQTDSFSIYYILQFYSSSTSTSSYCKCNIGGYITSLLALENFNLINNIPAYSFNYLFFGNKNLLSADNLITSNIISVGNSGFASCFSNCTSLVTAPTFENVTSVGNSGFRYCFRDCKSLVTAPTFENVTSVVLLSFGDCFRDCTSLVTPPTFDKVTSVGQQTFDSCFYNCTALVTAPTFENVTTLISGSFSSCFYNCTSLQTIIAPRPSTWKTSDFTNWVKGVPTSGTFYKKKGLTIPTGVDGIPEGWTVVEED